MPSELLAERYAQALFNIAAENKKMPEFFKQLNELVRLFKTQTTLENLFLAPNISKTTKKNIFRKILKNETNEFVFNFLCLLIDKKREEYFCLIVDKFNKILEKEENKLTVVVTTSFDVPAQLRDKMVKDFSEYFQKKVILKVQVNPQIIGGMVVKTEDKIIDGSIRRQLGSILSQN